MLRLSCGRPLWNLCKRVACSNYPEAQRHQRGRCQQTLGQLATFFSQSHSWLPKFRIKSAWHFKIISPWFPFQFFLSCMHVCVCVLILIFLLDKKHFGKAKVSCNSTALLSTIMHPRPFHSSGAVWESRWPSWAVCPKKPSGFRGRKDLLNHISALVTTCP